MPIMDLTFKTASTEIDAPITSDFKENTEQITDNTIEDRNQTVAELVGLTDIYTDLPETERDYIKSISDTLNSLIAKRGLQANSDVYKRLLTELKDDMEIDADTEPVIALEKLGKTLNAWRDVSFMRDSGDRRRIFMKLARAETSRDMDRIILDTMEKYGQ